MPDVPRSYRIYHTVGSRVVMILPTAMFLLFLLVWVALLTCRPTGSAEGITSIGVVTAFTGIMAYRWLRFTTVIDWHGDGTISFRAPLRTFRIPLAEIQSIRPTHTLGLPELHCRGKKLHLFSQLGEFHEFIHRLRKANPEMIIQGC